MDESKNGTGGYGEQGGKRVAAAVGAGGAVGSPRSFRSKLEAAKDLDQKVKDVVSPPPYNPAATTPKKGASAVDAARAAASPSTPPPKHKQIQNVDAQVKALVVQVRECGDWRNEGTKERRTALLMRTRMPAVCRN